MKLKQIELVVVTGAGSGIGEATALRFAKLGAVVVCIDIDEVTVARTVARIEAYGGRAAAYTLDVSDSKAFARVAEQIRKRHGVPDVVVSNAGIAKVGGTLTQTMDDWDRVVGIDLSGVVYGCQLFAAQMVERGRGGHLVNIASMAAYSPSVSFASYNASKAGVRMLSECLHAELRSDHIGVSAICPGAIDTNIWRTADFLAVDEAEASRRQNAIGGMVDAARRFGIFSGPDDVAKAILRAVEHDKVVVPVRPEAWFFYGLSRVAPDVLLLASRLTRDGTIEKLTSLVTRRAAPAPQEDLAPTA